MALMQEKDIAIEDTLRMKAEAWIRETKTVVVFADEQQAWGVLAISDKLKSTSQDAVKCLKEMGVEVWMLTGDQPEAAQEVARQVGIEHYKAGVLPHEKALFVQSLQARGKKVAMVGDGINDSASLAQADLSIAMGQGSDIAMDTAMVTTLSSDLMKVSETIRLSQLTVHTIRQNLFWAFFYNVVSIPIAVGAFAPLGLVLNPMIGAAAMSLSSFCVVTNALRIYLFNRGKKAKSRIDVNNSIQSNEFTVKVGGMMCGHCEARVSGALTALSFVSTAKADHKSGNVYITVSDTPDRDAIRAAVNEAGYKFGSIK
jgi:Cu2+-exporting ATPase